MVYERRDWRRGVSVATWYSAADAQDHTTAAAGELMQREREREAREEGMSERVNEELRVRDHG